MNAITDIAAGLPRWAAMWLLAAVVFYLGKAVMVWGAGLHGWRRAGFILAWVGMDTAPFFGRDGGRKHHSNSGFVVAWPLVNVVVGVLLLWGVARCFTHSLAAGWVGMVGLIFILHFGIFSLLAGALRAAGVPVTPIMNFPVAATSLSEFWGRRWNLAFRDLSHRLIFVPASRRWGPKPALWMSFAASGLVHDLIISLPAGAGYGLPTSYFLLQALGVMLERKAGKTTLRAAWLRTHAFTLLPAFLLFHPPFVERVMVPFFHAIGALP